MNNPGASLHMDWAGRGPVLNANESLDHEEASGSKERTGTECEDLGLHPNSPD